MASYSSRVRADAGRWVASGLIDGKTAEAIVLDVEAHERRSLSFGSILAIMAAGSMLPGEGKIFFSKYRWEDCLMHGGDSRRKATFHQSGGLHPRERRELQHIDSWCRRDVRRRDYGTVACGSVGAVRAKADTEWI